MKPARWLRDRPSDDRLLAVDVASGRAHDAQVRDLPAFLDPGDLVVVNDAATLPASVEAETGGQRFELRFASRIDGRDVWAVAFGAGTWRTPTERRAAPPAIRPGDIVSIIGSRVRATVTDSAFGRLFQLRWLDDRQAVLAAVYAHGHPIQYAHVDRDLPLWAVQAPFASRPWSVEMPSAGRAIGPSVVAALRDRGVAVQALTHAAGLSSTGDPRVDALLPLDEDYDIPVATANAVHATRQRGGRIIAIGTTVVRALESAAASGEVVAGPGVATLKLHPGYARRVVDGLLTGFHEEGSSHLELLASFAPASLLASTYAHALERGYLCHEFGDVNLVLAA